MERARLGKTLRLLRGRAGRSVKDVAGAMNVTRQTLSNWESGKVLPPLDALSRLAEVYDCELRIFFLPAGGQRAQVELSRTFAEVAEAAQAMDQADQEAVLSIVRSMASLPPGKRQDLASALAVTARLVAQPDDANRDGGTGVQSPALSG